jgi:co-chaperonin GroES (HSP10)
MQKKDALKLRMVGKGLRVKAVHGNRVLVKLVTPYTELDDYAKTLVVVNKEEHTPLPSSGIIIQVGDGVEGTTYQPGDMVMFSKYAGADFRIEEEDLKVLFANEIICTLEAAEGSTVEVIS